MNFSTACFLLLPIAFCLCEVQRVFTKDQLGEFNGSDPEKPIYFCVLGDVFDVSESKGFYGPNGEYSVFAGKDITRAIALWSKDQADIDKGMDIRGLTTSDMGNLDKIYKKFKAKYTTIGVMDYKKEKQDKQKQEQENLTKPNYPNEL